jgi:hypothetical protein
MRYTMLRVPERESLLASLAAMPAFLASAFESLTAEAATNPGPGQTFSPVEQCWHLADLERDGYAVRIRRLLAEEDPLLEDFDGARVAEERGYRRLSLADAIAAFRAARAANLQALLELSDADWARRGVQEGVGAITLCDVPAMMAEHDAGHRREIESWWTARSE